MSEKGYCDVIVKHSLYGFTNKLLSITIVLKLDIQVPFSENKPFHCP